MTAIVFLSQNVLPVQVKRLSVPHEGDHVSDGSVKSSTDTTLSIKSPRIVDYVPVMPQL